MDISRRWITAGAGVGTGFAVALALRVRSMQRSELQTVPYVDMERYQGRWFEIARYPTKFQRHCAKNTTAEYTIVDSGRVRVENRCTMSDGRIDAAHGWARIADNDTNGKLKVRFAPFVPAGDYWIIELADDYSYAVVGEPKRRFLWVLSRKPSMDDEIFQQLCGRLVTHGYDPAKLERTIQD